MAIKLTTTKQDKGHVKCLVYGPSGAGKTRLASTAPNPVIISSEKKLISLKDFNIPVILIENHEDLQDAYDFIMTDKRAKGFETVVIDSISDIAETILSYFKENPVDGNTHPQAAYGSMADTLSPLIKKFSNIPDKHVYVIAKSKMVEDQYTNVSGFSPSMPGKVLGMNLPYEFDFVFAMRMGEREGGEKFRYLQTQADIQWLAKGSENLDAMEEPNLTKLFKKALATKKKKKVVKKKVEPVVEEKEKEEERQEPVDEESQFGSPDME